MGAAVVLLAAASAQGQESAPSYAPGSILSRAAESVLYREEESDAFELEDWVPPVTNVQPSPPDWVPPTTEATPFPNVSEEPKSLAETPRVDPMPSDSLLIEPPTETPVSEPNVQMQAPAISAPAASDQNLVPFSDIEQSEFSPAETPSIETVPDVVQDVGPGINTSPEIPPTADLVGDELIEFDGNCLCLLYTSPSPRD